MLRLINYNQYPLNIPSYALCNSIACYNKCLGLYCKISSLFTSYSTLPKQKMIIKSNRPKYKVKLKNKPYQDLLKVLEVHRQELTDKTKKSVICNDEENMSFINEFRSVCKDKNLNYYNSDLYLDEGIYSTKAIGSNKEKNKNNCNEKSVSKKIASKNCKNKSAALQRINKEELEKLTKHKYALRTLKSYIEVSINVEEVEKAQKAFEYHREKGKRKNTNSFADIELYNMLLFGWAQKGRLDKVKHLFILMSNDKIVPNLQSYAGYIECISRSKFIDFLELQNILNEMKSKGYSAKNILEKCIFVRDQKEKIIEILGFVEQNLSLPQYKPGDAYLCKLLKTLNDKDYEKGDNHHNFCFQIDDIPKISASQIEVESKYRLRIKSVDAVTEVTDKILKARKYLKDCEDMWRKNLKIALKNIKNLEKKYHAIYKPSIYPYLAVIDTETLVDLLLQEIRILAETGEFFSPNVKVLYRQLGTKVMNHYFVWLNNKNQITDKVLFIYQKYLSFLLDPNLCAHYSPREYWEFLKHKYSDGPTIDISNMNWPLGVVTYIGRYLYDILRYNISFNANCVRNKSPSKVMSQAFYTAYEGLDVKLSKQIRTHSLLCKLYRDAKLEYLEFDVSLVPMLCPPHPWVKHDSGGLLITKTPFIRFPEQAQHQMGCYSKVPSQQLNPCFDSLNSLSLCPWIINKPILDLVINVFQRGGNDELDIPLNPNSFGNGPKMVSSMSKKEKAFIRKQKMELKKAKCEMTSLWFDCLYKLSIANHFRDKIFWFPHNLDFRGRVYPTPPHFNHLGNDMARSILLFADGQPLGRNGLNWLKMHLVNLTGFKKRDPHSERLKFANEILPEILDSADHPFEYVFCLLMVNSLFLLLLTKEDNICLILQSALSFLNYMGNQWWKTSDNPWQTLACCMELAAAVRHPNPEYYVSHFPVHQDGSCNGLQHYAALGRDELGAIEVNLHPSDSPQDVYSGVVALVEKERQKDAIDGVEIAQVLEGFVKRKVVKQTIMTFVYGVTTYGAKLQILKQLKDIPNFPEKYYHEGATYLMKKTFLSIREMFTATKQIQDWFTECAEQITRVSGDTLEWITPIGLPVIQPYHKEASIRSSKFCISQGKEAQTHYMSNYEPYQLPNIKKQKNAFAPNFIHSLDSTHMMLTSLFCQRKGITFVSVHDCFWTHPSTVEVMNKICRQQFVSLHSEPILENLSKFFLEKYARVAEENIQKNKAGDKSARFKLKDIVTQVPSKGTFNLNKVLESEYFFS